MRSTLSATIVLSLSLLGGVSLRWWSECSSGIEISIRQPQPAAETNASGIPDTIPLDPVEHCNRLQTVYAKLDGIPGKSSGRWPCFRGANRNGVCDAPTPLADAWPDAGPSVLWSITLGDGHAGAAIFEGCVYVLDYDETYHGDVLRSFSFDTGKEIWNRRYPVRTKRNHGISRSVPAVSENVIVTIGPKCHVMCVERETGNMIWGLDLVRDYGATVPLWYSAQCPLIDEETAVIAPAGKVLMMGVDCKTGTVVWRTPNPDSWEMSHSSIVLMQFGKTQAYVYCALGGMIAVSAEKENRGTILWKTSKWNKKIIAPCPVQLDDARILVTAGHGAGSMLFDVTDDGAGALQIKAVETIDKTRFACEQQTPVVYQGQIYTVLPKDAGMQREELLVTDLDLKPIWSTGKDCRFGLGPFVAADGKLYVLDDKGILMMFEAGRNECRILGKKKLFDGRDAWGPLAIADGRLIVRDSTRMLCLNIAEPNETGDH